MTLSRRRFLAGAGGLGAASALGLPSVAWRARAATSTGSVTAPARDVTAAALAALGRTTLRLPGSLPDETMAAGTATLPGIEHIVVLMMENHSYDNFFGMLGREPGGQPRGDGFRLDRHGRPTATNPYGDGRIQHAFHMPTTCQLPSTPSQEWTASHVAWNGGRLDGFVRAPIYYTSTER